MHNLLSGITDSYYNEREGESVYELSPISQLHSIQTSLGFRQILSFCLENRRNIGVSILFLANQQSL